MRKLLLVAAIALLAAPPAAGAVTVQPYEARAFDGTVLRGHVYLPDGPGPYATILEYSPYYNHPTYGRSDEQTASEPIATLLAAGFAVVLVNMRGTGDSDGCNAIGGPIDVEDVTAVIHDLAKRPWSTGSIGMIGHSYSAWTQDMAAAAAPAPLKAVIPTSGVIDLWSLLTRRGAPLAAGLGVLFAPAWTALTVGDDERILEHLACPELPLHYYENAQTATSGDRTPWFRARSLRERLRKTPVPMLRSNGLLPVGEGHILQVEGLWRRLRSDRSHMILGQWNHETPSSNRDDWLQTVVAWFDHYLRGVPKTVETGVVEYQSDDDAWHTAARWPPRSHDTRIRLSGAEVVWDGATVEPADQTFVSGDIDPGLGIEGQDPRIAVSACGPHQVLYVSPPLARDALVAGNFEVDVEITSTLPGGNFSVYLWKTPNDGSCPDDAAAVFGRAPLDLRHWATPGNARDFPVAAPTRVRLRSHPLASQLRAGERIVVAIGGGNVELTPDPLHPVITVHSGSFELPVVSGELRFEGQPRRAGARPAAARRRPPRSAGRG